MKKLFLLIFFFNSLFANFYGDAINEFNNGNKEKGLKQLRHICDIGNGGAAFCLDIGDKFLKGEILPKNLTYAKEFYNITCKKSYLIGCLKEATLYFKEGKTKKALDIATKACKKGGSSSCFLVALIYKEENNKQGFFDFLNEACNKNSYKACHELGIVYTQGLDNIVSTDDKKAYELFDNSCIKGKYKAACAMKAEFYVYGAYVKKDLFIAEFMLKDLCDKNEKVGCIFLNKLNKEYDLSKNKNYLTSKEKFRNEQIKRGYTIDIRTNLMWQDNKDSVTVKYNQKEAKNYCKKLELGGFYDWELPEYISMLDTLIDKKSKTNTTPIILNSIKGIYWTPISYYGRVERRGVSFKDPLGIVDIDENSLNYVRCVRKNK